MPIPLLITALTLSTPVCCAAWYADAHMLIGQLASEYASNRSVASIERLLIQWTPDWPHTSANIASASIWADVLKCRRVGPPACFLGAAPSLRLFNHTASVAIDLASGRVVGEPSGKDNAVAIVEEAIETLSTTQSLWSANFMVRMLLHLFADLHQPLHAISGVDRWWSDGDRSGGARRFRANCSLETRVSYPLSLHKLWDSGGNLYTTIPRPDNIDSVLASVRDRSEELIRGEEWQVNVADPLRFQHLDDFPRLLNASRQGLFRKVARESRKLAKRVVYRNLDLREDAKRHMSCPSARYMTRMRKVSRRQTLLAGKRLGVLVEVIGRQLEHLFPN